MIIPQINTHSILELREPMDRHWSEGERWKHWVRSKAARQGWKTRRIRAGANARQLLLFVPNLFGELISENEFPMNGSGQ